jgi:thiamine-phosphate diphosphorylase/hydroxyethylthiazole kinase
LWVLISASKTNTKSIIGTAGVQKILEALATEYDAIRTVCIGGINSSNIQRVLFQASSNRKKLDGVAVVSAIIAAEDPQAAASHLRDLIAKPPPFVQNAGQSESQAQTVTDLLAGVPKIVKEVTLKRPLSHNITNLVVQNFAANVALAVGASPIMANYGEEAADLCKLGGALVINMGTVTPEGLHNYQLALRAYNAIGGPVVLDPVGAGATAIRRNAVRTLMATGYFDLIKGNEGEIKTVFGEAGVQQRGVDSGSSTLNSKQKAAMVRALADRERNVVLMTGAEDYVSDGRRTFLIKNGNKLLGDITGSGCVLGTTISAMMAVYRQDKLLAVIAGLLHYEIAAEHAADRDDVKGPGTFVPALIDEISSIKERTASGDFAWLDKAKLEQIDQE